ncbi:hypothetical protein D3C83_170630 [compost metagenome]
MYNGCHDDQNPHHGMRRAKDDLLNRIGHRHVSRLGEAELRHPRRATQAHLNEHDR